MQLVWSFIGVLALVGLYFGLFRLSNYASAEMAARGQNGEMIGWMILIAPFFGIPYWLVARRSDREIPQ